MRAARILVVDDQPHITHLVANGLSRSGFDVLTAASFDDGRDMVRRRCPDLLVLDLELVGPSGRDGPALLRMLRDVGSTLPVIVLTGDDFVSDPAAVPRAGVADWVLRPFLLDELIARVHAALRRTGWDPGTAGPLLRVTDLELHEDRREVVRDGRRIVLTPTEFALLRLLMRNSGAVLGREDILRQVWRRGPPDRTRLVEIYIGYLRRKIDDGRPPLIHTVRGVGYVMRPP